MLLATIGLLYVIQRTVPATPYLTLLDKFVVTNLGIQILNALCTWGELHASEGHEGDIDAVAAYMLPLLLICSVGYYLVSKIVQRRDREEWPKTLGQAPGVSYHLFKKPGEHDLYCNVFPQTKPGDKDPRELPPKEYGGKAFGARPQDAGYQPLRA